MELGEMPVRVWAIGSSLSGIADSFPSWWSCLSNTRLALSEVFVFE